MSWLAMPEVWVGVGLFAIAAVLLMGGEEQKKRKARLVRVTSKTPLRAQMAAGAQSLRRKDPNENSAIGQKLAEFSSIEKLRGRLEMAGMTATPQKLLAYAGGIALVTFFLISILLGKKIIIGSLVGLLLGLGLPHLYIKRRLRKRQMAFLKLFPEAIDLMVRGLRAGLPVAESFNVVSRELPAPMGDTFATISQQTQLGVPMEKALTDASIRIDMTEFNFFVTTIILQRETGGNLGEILSNLSDMLRQRQMMKLKIGALSSEARASAYIVGALPFVVWGLLSMVSPAYLQPLYNDFRGNMALMVAGGMILVGGFIMKRMTMLEI
jgi:tight adherence protein B